MSAVSCAIIAAAETIYNFGFLVEEETCMACRAGGMPRGIDIMEVSFARSAHVDGKKYQIWRCVFNNIVDLHGMYIKELCLPRIKLFSQSDTRLEIRQIEWQPYHLLGAYYILHNYTTLFADVSALFCI